MEWRFAQISDVRLGAKLAWLEGDIASAIRDASRQALVDAFRIAHEQHCEAVLIPGDLYSLKGIDPAGQLRFVYERAADYPSRQFLIMPGHSDAYGGNGPYVYLKPPANVYVFSEPDWQTRELPGVTVTARAHQVGEGSGPLPWQSLPRPNPDKLSVVMMRGRLAGMDDGRGKRGSEWDIEPEQLLNTGYDYTALGGMHAQIEVPGNSGKIAAAYAGMPQCLGWDSRGPGGILTGTLTRDGAELAFHPTERFHWQKRKIPLPRPYADSYQLKLDAALQALSAELGPSDLCQLTVSGELHQDHRELLEEQLREVRESVFHVESDTANVSYLSGLNPARLPSDSLLSSYLQRCAAEAAQAGSDEEVYELARRLGWLLFTGQGLPAEISQ